MNELVYIILVSVLLGASVVIVGFGELNNFLGLNQKQELIFEIKQLDNSISSLSKYSYGSFDTFYLKVPNGGSIVIYKNSTLIIDGRYKYKINRRVNCITFDSNKCQNKVRYIPGNYKLILYHGSNANAKYSIAFE